MIVKNLGKILFIFLLPIILNAEVKFEVKLSKDKIYLNETIKADLILTTTNDEKIDQTYFRELDIDDFWAKRLNYTKPIKNKDTTIYSFTFLLEPKVVGVLTVPEQFVEISSKKLRANFKRWEKIYSKEKLVEVLALPNETNIQGDYTINLKANKQKVKANEPVNLTLKIKGSGNIKDIKAFDLGLKDKIVYSDTPNITSKFEGDSYRGEFTQKFSIVANKSFSIHQLELKYLDIQKDVIKTISTKPMFIEVEENKELQKDEKYLKYIFGIVGIVLGFFIFYIFKYLRKKLFKKVTPLEVQIKKAKSDKELYKLLLPYTKELDDIMQNLEENIYQNKNNKIDKKDIIRRVNVYN